ncbi:MAG TPA: ABC transporter substrate-binding protein [Candidatus Dormibacteraeota bacterium]
MPAAGPIRFRPSWAAAAVVAILLAGACGGGGASRGQTPSAPRAATGSKLDLEGVCPSTVVVQMNWFPQAEHGSLYRLLGTGYAVDAGQKRVSAELVASGQDTGVRLEVRSGGPAIGFQQVSAQMYLDPAITLGAVASDEAVQNSKDHPTLQVMAPMDLNPQVILWSPQKHPDWRTIADIGRSTATVLYFGGATYMEYLVGTNLLHRSQVDASYDGTPSRFVASGGAVAQQGYATNEPYLYSRELPAWNRPIKFQLVHDTGYPIYPDAFAIRSGDRTRLAPCLQRLAPILQRSTVDYIRDPRPTNSAIVDMVRRLNAAQDYTLARANYAGDEMKKLGIIGNGTNTTLGDFDMARILRVIDITGPIFAREGKPIAPGLRPQDVATNEFLDASIGLPG